MNNKILSIIMLIVTTSFWAFGGYVQLPASFKDKAVYYKYSYALDNWSCGYNCLLRACQIEGNIYQDPNQFKALCLPYIRAHKQTTQEAAYFYQLRDLTEKLGLQKLCMLYQAEHTSIVPIIEELSRPTARNKKALFTNKQIKRLRQEIIDDAKEYLQQRKNRVSYVHFICHIITHNEDHGVLASLKQDQNGHRSLYVFDSNNEIITEQSILKCHLDYLVKEFSVDTQNTHKQSTK